MPRPGKKPHGELRQSQVVTMFGPGSMVDLPRHAVLVSGLDDWSKGGQEIHEPRLTQKLLRLLEVPSLKLITPPPEEKDPGAQPTGITAWKFPEWFITQDVNEGGERQVRSRYLVHRRLVERGVFRDLDRKRRSVVPVRFVRACRRGHIGDIDWFAFLHAGKSACKRQLWMVERGTSGDLSEITVRCDCGTERPVSDAARMETKALGTCDGNRPWLGPDSREGCGEPNRLLIRTASNAYFPQVMSVISIPQAKERLVKAVSRVWEHYLQYVDDVDQLKEERRRKPPVHAALDGHSDEDVMEEIRSRKGEAKPSSKTVKQAELETLMASQEEIGEDRPEGDFFARSLPRAEWDAAWMGPVDRVVLVHRLREVTAQVGFTRFEAAAPDIEGELEMGVTRATLARHLSWLPAVENKGEGFFIAFNPEAIERWMNRPEVQRRAQALMEGFNAWKAEHKNSRRDFPGARYIMLHSLSHLLLTAVSLECGYPASSINERVYARGGGYGILLYTGSPDAEGTLGGLVETGRQVARHLWSALELGELCSNDPVCAQHAPDNKHEHRFLQGAACHGCLLIAETSCEMYNDFLDRSLVVPTVDGGGAAFFDVRGR